ncbi:hypothetical protein APHAL10511_000448 [Amanita phalloides]|nr:hypothetical protein APHAL10511_000448 [Amanita phalloides]
MLGQGQYIDLIPERQPGGCDQIYLSVVPGRRDSLMLGLLSSVMACFGFVNSWGVFQSYYSRTILKDSSPSTIAWIGSIQYALGFLPALLVGRMFDLGYFRSILLTSSVLLILATFLVAECTVYWQFLLCQGFALGLGSGGIFGPTMAVVQHWFKKRRGLAMGLVMIGSSLGGTLLPVAVKNLMAQVGFKWTMRLIGCFLLLTLGLSNLMMKRRLPPKNVPGGLLNLSAFRSPAFTIYCISAFTTFLGLYTLLTYVDVAAEGVPGMSETLAFYLVSIANVSSLIGRYVSGVISDRVGPMNVMIPYTMLAGVMTFVWPYVRMEHGLVAIAIMYGFCSGVYIALFLNPLIMMGDMNDVGRRIGMFMSIVALGALAGPPISGALNKASGGDDGSGEMAGIKEVGREALI